MAFLDFLRAKLSRPVVRDGCRKDGNRSLGKTIPDSPTHLLRGADVYTFRSRGGFQHHGSADQNHSCAALRRSVGNRVTHLAGRAIGDVANRIEVFASRTGGKDRKSTRLNSSHGYISYAVFCLKKKNARSEGGATSRHARACP